MTKLRVYPTLDDALEDIRFERGKFLIKEFRFVEGSELEKDKSLTYGIDSLFDNVRNALEEYRLSLEVQHSIFNILVELVANAYRQIRQNEKCYAEVYISKIGVLLGTKQDNEFLTEEQIKLLKEGKKVSSTKENIGGDGTEIFIDEGDGILIDKLERAIYISKYF